MNEKDKDKQDFSLNKNDINNYINTNNKVKNEIVTNKIYNQDKNININPSPASTIINNSKYTESKKSSK